MGLFDKLKKKNETHKENYSEEQKELKFIIQQNQAIFGNVFLGKRATDAEIAQADSRSFCMVFKRIWLWWILVRHNGGIVRTGNHNL